MRRFYMALACVPAFVMTIGLAHAKGAKAGGKADVRAYKAYEKALNDHYAKNCIFIDDTYQGREFPVTVALHDEDGLRKGILYSGDQQTREKWDSLVKVGLLSVKESRGSAKDEFGSTHPTHSRIYSLTEQGKAAYSPYEGICVGHYRVTAVQSATKPAPLPGGSQGVTVSFTASAEGIPDWTKDEAVQKAWPELEVLLKPDQPKQRALIKTDSGWVDEREFTQDSPQPRAATFLNAYDTRDE